MAHRLIFQILITGTQAMGKAFGEAWKQAAATTANAGAAKAAKTEAHSSGVRFDEALQILDLTPKELTPEKVKERYNYLFSINAKEKGGSFYLQSKVYRAMERLQSELDAAAAARGKDGAGAADGATSSR